MAATKFSTIKWGDGLTVTDEGAGVIRVDAGGGGGGGSSGSPTFVLTNLGVQITVSPTIIAGADFYSSDPATFDVSGGRARILRPGMYVIALQEQIRPDANFTVDQWVLAALKYQHNEGQSIEIPYLISGFEAGGGEQVMGTRFTYPAGTGSSYDVALQRLHPVSFTTATTFPLEILPTVYTSDESGNVRVFTFALWGWRLGEPVDSYHSD